MPSLRLQAVVLVTLVAVACGDPYDHYAATVRDDVDASMTDAFQMTARLQLTVVDNQIPDESLSVAAATVTRAARAVKKRAAHFAHVTPPADLAEAHAGLSNALSRAADALEALGAAFQECAALGAAPSPSPCQGHIDSISNQYQFVGEDLQNGRVFVKRMLLRHGVLLRP